MKKEKVKQYTTDGIKILHELFIKDDPEMPALLKEEGESADIAQRIYDMRTREGLTQKKLADLIGTTSSVISRLEDADYDGYSMKMLNRIANALGYSIHIDFQKAEKRDKDKTLHWMFNISDSIEWSMKNERCLFAA
jgi:transcriptional regulator with XRE-family HTH domain